MHMIKSLFAVCIAVSCHGATDVALTARYGLPIMQQFKGAPAIIVTVEYGGDQRPRKVQLLPPDSDRPMAGRMLTLDAAAVSELMDFFVAPGRRALMTSRRDCGPGSGLGNGLTCTQIETGDGVVITRLQPKDETGQPTSEADFGVTITCEQGLPQTDAEIQAHFGPAVADESTAEPGVSLTAKYNASRSASEFVIKPLQSSLDAQKQPTPMLAATVDRMLEELVPLDQRLGTVTSMAIATGNAASEVDTFDNVTISRVILLSPSAFGDQLVQQARVRWGPRQFAQQ
jgi:hypothetical protein